MHVRVLMIGVAAACSVLGEVAAADLEFSAATYPLVRVGVNDLEYAGGTLGFGVSSEALEARFERRVNLSVAGTASLAASAAYGYDGGARFGLAGRGTLGPVAASFDASAWTSPLQEFDPLLESSFEGASLLPSGVAVEADAKYRLRRDVVLNASGEFGRQVSVAAWGEWRRDAVSWRGGARVGEGVAGVVLGATWRGDSVTVSGDALLGPGSQGWSVSADLLDPLRVPSNLMLYAVYEPWRRFMQPLRVGASLSAEVGRGVLEVDVRGGSGNTAARVGYVLPLNQEE